MSYLHTHLKVILIILIKLVFFSFFVYFIFSHFISSCDKDIVLYYYNIIINIDLISNNYDRKK